MERINNPQPNRESAPLINLRQEDLPATEAPKLGGQGSYSRGNFTSALRDETQQAHMEVEDGTHINRILAGRLDPVNRKLLEEGKLTETEYEQRRTVYLKVYKAALAASYGFEKALEQRLDETPIGAEARRVLGIQEPTVKASELIAKDLQLVQANALQDLAPLPEYTSVPEIIGALYVRLGSRKGGLIIAKAVKSSLDIGADTGAGFFGYLGAATNGEFNAFLKAVDGYSQDPHAISEAVKSAQRTFQAVGIWQDHVYKELIPELYQNAKPSLLKRGLKALQKFFVRDT